jgi:hypothetical protein
MEKPMASSPDAAAGIPSAKDSGGLFEGLNVVDSPPSSPRPKSFDQQPDTKDIGGETDNHEDNNKDNRNNENFETDNNKEVEDVNSNLGTPESSIKSEESAVMVEKEDANMTETDDSNPNNAIDGGEETEGSTAPAPSAEGSNSTIPTTTEIVEDIEDQVEVSNDINDSSLVTETDDTPMVCFIHAATPIPNSDSSLRILRKFINKTSKHFPASFGGTKPPSLIHYLFGSSNVDIEDECCFVYKELIEILSANIVDEVDSVDEEGDGDTDQETKENEVVIESILGHSGDTMSKARRAMATFCRLIETWCLETQRVRIVETGEDLTEYVENLEKSHFYMLRTDESENIITSLSSVVTTELISIALTSAEALVAHGCFDGVMIGIGEEQNTSSIDLRLMPSITEEMAEDDEEPQNKSFSEPKFENAVTVLAESIFHCSLDSEEVELAGLKFLLTTGCRTAQSVEGGHKEALLRGSYLLQTIRMCYRVYLSTQSKANKTTARAALRQIVTSTFKRLEMKSDDSYTAPIMVEKGNDDPFSPPVFDENEDHMKKIEDRSVAGMSYGGNFSTFEHKDAYLVLRSLCKLSMKASVTGGAFQTVTISHNDSLRSVDGNVSKNEMLMDPSLDSKILALDLLVEILQGTKTEILLNAGPQLIYAVRNYLCHSLLKNCTSDNNYVVSLSLRLFVPLIRHFRAHLKTEIEAFVTNVFFVILDSKNSAIEHKLRVVILFEEICSDPATLAEIFLNYDCDLSAVDLFQRIVNTLAKVAKIGLLDKGMNSSGIFVAGAGASRAEKSRQDHRELRLEAMKAVKQVLSSLHESFVAPILAAKKEKSNNKDVRIVRDISIEVDTTDQKEVKETASEGLAGAEKQSLVQIYDSKKKRREEASRATLRFNQKPSAGIKLASEVGLINGDDPADVAQFLLNNKDVLDKTQIGEYLGREIHYQNGFPLKVLHQYLNLLDFSGLAFDDAIKFYLSGFRLPGEAQKVS